MNYETLIERYFIGSLVDGVHDGNEAIKLLEETGFNFYDVIIMDY